MSLSLCIIASGSSGNCALVRTPAGILMIDAGIGPRVLAKRLNGTGVSISDISAVLLTHLDADHFRREWIGTLVRNQTRVFVHQGRRHDLSRNNAGFLSCIRTFHDDVFEPIPSLQVEPIALSHDQTGCHGFILEAAHSRLGFATDLGHVPKMLIDRFDRLSILAIESNYDPEMQLLSGRPTFLQRRIMGGHGHLSNAQAMDCVRLIFDRATRERTPLPDHVVLLHRSRQCNCPDLLRSHFSQDERIAQRLTLADPYEATRWLHASRREPVPLIGQQLELAFG